MLFGDLHRRRMWGGGRVPLVTKQSDLPPPFWTSTFSVVTAVKLLECYEVQAFRLPLKFSEFVSHHPPYHR